MWRPRGLRRVTLHRVPALCPKCGWRPPIRVYPWMVAAAAGLPPDTPLVSFRCHRKGCGHIYPITARDVQKGLPENEAA